MALVRVGEWSGWAYSETRPDHPTGWLFDRFVCHESDDNIEKALGGDQDGHDTGVVSDQVLTEEESDDADAEGYGVDPDGARLNSFFHWVSRLGVV